MVYGTHISTWPWTRGGHSLILIVFVICYVTVKSPERIRKWPAGNTPRTWTVSSHACPTTTNSSGDNKKSLKEVSSVGFKIFLILLIKVLNFMDFIGWYFIAFLRGIFKIQIVRFPTLNYQWIKIMILFSFSFFLSFLLFDLDCNEVKKKQKNVDRIFMLHLNNYFGVSIWQNEFS